MSLEIFLKDDFATNPEPFIAFLDTENDLNSIEASLVTELDQIEASLMNELSSNSSIFSNTLGIVDDVRATFSGLSSATNQIKAQLDEFTTKLSAEITGLELMHKRLVYLENTHCKLNHLKGVLKDQKKIQELVNLCSFDDALFLISKTRAEIENDLSDFEPFKELSDELHDMKLALEKMKNAPSLE